MKKALFFLMTFSTVYANAQAPSIVKPVASTVTEPKDKDQEGWKSNEWNGKFFYQGTGSPTKLCITDGTNAGTVYLADIGSGIVVATIPAQDFMYIITNRLASFSPFLYEAQIWRSNGTGAGTSLVYTMPQAGTSSVSVWTSDRDAKKNYSVSGNTMFFGGYDATNGNELWVTDGTAGGTHIVADIKAGIGNSSPQAFCKIGTDIFFTCTQTGFERKLWKTDGTAGGTVQIPVAEPFFILDNAVGLVNNKMIFYAHNTVDGYEPYVSDGTAAGTFMLANINPAGNSWLSQSQNAHLRFNNSHCFFIANNGTANALWRTDGTSTGTIQLTTDAQAAFSGVSGGSYTEVDNNGLWMIEYNSGGSGNNEKLYRSNGTVAGTYIAASGLSYGQYIKSYKGGLWMASRNVGSAANVEPWRSGGNMATTNKAFEIEPGNAGSPTFTPISSSPYGFFVKDGKLFFFASTSIPSGHNLYQYTGDFTFTGATNNNWQDSTNWSGRMPPGITDSAFIETGRAAVVTGRTVYAGTLKLDGSGVILTNTTDSLIIHKRLEAVNNPGIGGNGVIAFYNIQGDTAFISDRFDFSYMAIMSHTKIDPALPYNGINLLVNGGLNIVNNSQFYIGNLHLLLPFMSSYLTTSGNSFVNTNGTGMLRINNVGATGRSGNVLFPVGSGNNYNPVIINNAGTNTTVSVKTEPKVSSIYYGPSQNGTDYYNSSAVDNSWYIEAPGAGVNATVTLQWNDSQELPGFNRSQAYLGHWKFPAGWDLGTVGTVSGTNPYTITRTGVTDFSPFGILNNNLVLPLRFLSFTAQKCGNNICLNWKTADEQNVSYFEIERSTDGRNFTAIKNEPAKNQPLNLYSYADDVSGFSNGKLLYRIRQVDTDGKVTYSRVVVMSVDGQGISIYPSVFSKSFTTQNYSNSKMKLELFAPDGSLLHTQNILPGTNAINITHPYSGAVFYRIYGENGLLRQTGKLMKL